MCAIDNEIENLSY